MRSWCFPANPSMHTCVRVHTHRHAYTYHNHKLSFSLDKLTLSLQKNAELALGKAWAVMDDSMGTPCVLPWWPSPLGGLPCQPLGGPGWMGGECGSLLELPGHMTHAGKAATWLGKLRVGRPGP